METPELIIDEIMENYLDNFLPNTFRSTVVDIFKMLNNIDKYATLETKLLDILTDENDDTPNDSFRDYIILYLQEVIKEYNVVVSIDNEVALYYLIIVLNTILEVKTYNEISTELILDILSDDEITNEEKFSHIASEYSNIPWIELMDILDDVSDSYIEELKVYIETLIISNELEDIELSKLPEVGNSILYKTIVNNNDDEVVSENYLETLYDILGILNYDISKSVREITTLLLASSDIENKFYFIDSVIQSDLEELGLTKDQATALTTATKHNLTIVLERMTND